MLAVPSINFSPKTTNIQGKLSFPDHYTTP